VVSILPANGAVKAGASCSPLGKKVIQSGSEFRCVKSGKKLVWKEFRKVAPVPTISPTPKSSSTPSPSPTITVTPTPSPSESATTTGSSSPTPTPLPSPTQITKPITTPEILWSRGTNGVFPIEQQVWEIPTVIPASWQDVYEKRIGIPYQAWLAVSRNISANSSKLGKVEILTGPNTVPNFSNIKLPMELVSRAFPTAKNVTSLRIFVFNFKDSMWADETFKRLYTDETTSFKNRYSNAVSDVCPKDRQVCYAQAFVDSKYEGIILQGMTDIGSREQLNQTYSDYARSFLGINIAHEYFHTVQRVILGDRWTQRIYTPPSWFIEGSAVFIEGAVLNLESFNGLMRFRAVDSKVLYTDCPYEYCVKASYERVLDFLSMSHSERNWENFPYAMKYEMSARTVEILVALKGPESLIALMENMATGKTFEQAFEFVYGISYETAKPIIASIVADQFANGR